MSAFGGKADMANKFVRLSVTPLVSGAGRCAGLGGWSAHDVGLNYDVVSTTNQHKMFDIVTANELDTSFSVELDGFDYSYPL